MAINKKLARLHDAYSKHTPIYVAPFDSKSYFQVAQCSGCGLVLSRYSSLAIQGNKHWEPMDKYSCEQFADWYPTQSTLWRKLLEDCYE